MAAEELDVKAIQDYCLQRLPSDSPTFIELNEEFLLDPENSRVGRYCREGEQIAAFHDSAELDWEKLLENWETAQADGDSAIADEQLVQRNVPTITDSANEWGATLAQSSVPHGWGTAEVTTPVHQREKQYLPRSHMWRGISVASLVLVILFSIVGNEISRRRNAEQLVLSDALKVLAHDDSASPRPTPEAVRSAIEIVRTRLGTEHPMYWHGVELLSFVLERNRQFQDAIDAGLLFAGQPGLSSDVKAERLFKAGQFTEHIPRGANQGKHIYQKVIDLGETRFISDALLALSRIDEDEGNRTAALDHAKDAVAAAVDDADKYDCLERVVLLLYGLHDWLKLRETVARRIEIGSRIPREGRVFDFEMLAIAAHFLNNPTEEVQARLNMVYAIDGGRYPRDQRYAESLSHLANCYSIIGNNVEGRRWIRKALDEFERQGFTSGGPYALALAQAARMSDSRGTNSDSYAFSIRSIELFDRLPQESRDLRSLALVHETLSQNQLRSERIADAEESAKRGLALAEQIGERGIASSLNIQLAYVALKRKDYHQVIELTRKAGRDNPGYAIVARRSLAGSGFIGQKKWEEALSELEPAVAVAANDNDKGILKFQIGSVLSNIPGREEESVAMLLESKPLIARLYPEAEITMSNVSNYLLASQPPLTRMENIQPLYDANEDK